MTYFSAARTQSCSISVAGCHCGLLAARLFCLPALERNLCYSACALPTTTGPVLALLAAVVAAAPAIGIIEGGTAAEEAAAEKAAEKAAAEAAKAEEAEEAPAVEEAEEAKAE